MKKIILVILAAFLTLQFLYAQSIAITEIMYNTDNTIESTSWVELYNYGSGTVDLSNWKLRDETAINVFTIPSSTDIGAGEYLVLSQWTDSFSLIYPTVTNVIGDFEFGLDNTSGSVRLYNAADVLIKSVNYIDSLPWPNAADGLGPSLQIDDYSASAADPANWFAGCVGGSPGAAYTPCDYAIVVSEINYNSAADFDMKNWIELWNHTNVAIDISGWKFRDSKMDNVYTIPEGTNLGAGERLVICDSLPAMNALWPYVTNIIGEFDFGLSNNGDAIRLYDSSDKLKYSVRFNDDAPWPVDADGDGYTLELEDAGTNPNLPASWFAGCPHGSPGSEFTLPCGVAVEELNTNSGVLHISPNPFSNIVTIYIENFGLQAVENVSVLNLYGEQVATFTAQPVLSWNGKDTGGNELATGIYFVHLLFTNGESTLQKIIKL